MFDQGKVDLEKLPPTEDALELHLSCANYQVNVWLQADQVEMNVDPPTSVLGWRRNPDRLQIESIPSKCIESITCGCEEKCKTAACKCFKSGQRCMGACGCHAEGCLNPG